MNKKNLSTVSSESDSQKSELVPESDRAIANEIIERYLRMAPAEPGFTLDDVFEVIRRRFLYLLAGAVIGVMMVAVMLYWIKPLYAVSARVVITQQDPGKLVDTDSGSSTFIATQAEVISSPEVVQEAVATLPRPAHLEPEDDAVLDALDAVQASAISGTRVIALGYLGPDADYGAQLLTAMVDVYVANARDSASSGQTKSLDAKSAELKELLEEIAQQESQIKEARQENDIFGTADEAAAAQLDQLRDNATELREVRNRRIELESRRATGGAGSSADDPVRRSLREDLRQAESELAKARVSLTAEHPSVVAAERNVEVLRAQLSSHTYTSPDDLGQQIREATRLETELASIEAQSKARLKAIELHRRVENKALIELERLRSLAEERQRELIDQRMVARLAQAGDVGIGARIIAVPVVFDDPVWPKPKMMLPAGALAGLTIGFVFALISLRGRRESDVADR